jgi:hypothetical protein
VALGLRLVNPVPCDQTRAGSMLDILHPSTQRHSSLELTVLFISRRGWGEVRDVEEGIGWAVIYGLS